jgi:hypothetical protein
MSVLELDPVLDEVAPTSALSEDPCQKEGCTSFLPLGHHVTRKYCDEHQPAASKKRDKVPGDKPPTTVNFNIKTPTPKAKKGDDVAAKVEAGAAAMLGFLPMALAMAGDAECSTALQSSIPAIARQLGELSRFHPGMVKIFAPAESTGEVMAWVGLVIAVAPVIITILVHHKLVSPKLAETLASVAGFAMANTNG